MNRSIHTLILTLLFLFVGTDVSLFSFPGLPGAGRSNTVFEHSPHQLSGPRAPEVTGMPEDITAQSRRDADSEVTGKREEVVKRLQALEEQPKEERITTFINSQEDRSTIEATISAEAKKREIVDYSRSSLENRIKLYQLEYEWLCTYLAKRTAVTADQKSSNRLSVSSMTTVSIQENTVENALQKIHQIGEQALQNLLSDFQRSELANTTITLDNVNPTLIQSISDSDCSLLHQLIDLVRESQFFVLGYDSPRYINMNTDQVTVVQEVLQQLLLQLKHQPLESNTQPINDVNHMSVLDQKETFSTESPLETSIIRYPSQAIQPPSPYEENAASDLKDHCIRTQQLLEKVEADFSLIEATSSRKTVDAARTSFKTLQEQKSFIKKSLYLIQHEADSHTTPSEMNQILKNKVAFMKNLLEHLQQAMSSYSAIEDEAWIEEKCGSLTQLKKDITGKLEQLSKNDRLKSSIADLENTLDESKFFVSNSDIPPQTTFAFLNDLPSFKTDSYKDAIIGYHGRIALQGVYDEPSWASLRQKAKDQHRRAWAAGIKLILLGLHHRHGIEVVQKFKDVFEAKLACKNPLTLQELIHFLRDNFDASASYSSQATASSTEAIPPREYTHDQSVYQNSFFIKPNMSFEDFAALLSRPNTDDDLSNRVLKLDTTLSLYNPFHKDATSSLVKIDQSQLTAANLQHRKAALDYIARFIQERAFFEEAPTKAQLEAITTRLHQSFAIHDDTVLDGKDSLLTLNKLRHFLEEENNSLKNRDCWERYISPYLDQNARQSIRNGFFYSTSSLFFSHVPTALILILSYFYYFWHKHTPPSSSPT